MLPIMSGICPELFAHTPVMAAAAKTPRLATNVTRSASFQKGTRG